MSACANPNGHFWSIPQRREDGQLWDECLWCYARQVVPENIIEGEL